MITVFSAICDFVLEYKAEIAGKVIASAAYDGLKKILDLNKLKEKIGNFFRSEKETDEYLKRICTSEAENPSEPYKDITNHYKDLSGRGDSVELINVIKDWIKENESTIFSIGEMNFNNESGFNIGSQNATKNIFNIQGDFIQTKKKKS